MNYIVESQTTTFENISFRFFDMSISDSLSFNVNSDGLFILNYSKDTIQRQYYITSVKIKDLNLLDNATTQLQSKANCMVDKLVDCIDCPEFILKIQYRENQGIDSKFNFPIQKCYKPFINILFEIARKYSTCDKDSTFNFFYNRILGKPEKVRFIKPNNHE
jgi:hypothetical protein